MMGEVGVDDEETGICVYSFVLIFPCALAEGFILRAERRSHALQLPNTLCSLLYHGERVHGRRATYYHTM